MENRSQQPRKRSFNKKVRADIVINFLNLKTPSKVLVSVKPTCLIKPSGGPIKFRKQHLHYLFQV